MFSIRDGNKKLLLLIFILIFLFLAGCPDPIVEPQIERTLTITVEGEGVVFPDTGAKYISGSIATIVVSPRDGWEFDRFGGSHGHQVAHVKGYEYQLLMDSNKSIRAIFTKKASLPVITSIESVPDIEVPYGATRQQAIGALSPTTTITDSNNQRHVVDLTWSIRNYNGYQSGDYLATGAFSLPEGVAQPYPPMQLEVLAIVTVLPQTTHYTISGAVTSSEGSGIPGVTISFTGGFSSVTTDAAGYFSRSGLHGSVTVTPTKDNYLFSPPSRVVTAAKNDVNFAGTGAHGNNRVSGSLSIHHDWHKWAIRGEIEGKAPTIRAKEMDIAKSFIGESVPGQIIVGFYPYSPEATRVEVFKDLQAKKIGHIPSLNAYLLEVPKGAEDLALDRARERGSILYVMPNYKAYATARAPNDEFYSYQWHYPLIRLPYAWSASIGDYGVRVAVLDTGINTNHPDLGNMVDTASGFNFIDYTKNSNDLNGHGSHVAGTIGANTNNSIGVAGVMWETSLIPVKVLDDLGEGNHWSIANGILYGAGLLTDPYLSYPAHIINMSLGSPNGSPLLEDAIKRAHGAGAILVAATGNTNTSIMYPAKYPEVIAVGAVDYNYPNAPQRAYYSCYGMEIDVVAPGGDVRVDSNNDGYIDGVLSTAFDQGPYDYYFYEGTSMAAPHVSGVIGLMLAAGIDKRDVRDILQRTSMDLGDRGFDHQHGHGLINAYWAVNQVATIKILVGERQGNTIRAVAEEEISLDQRSFSLGEIPAGNYRVYAWIDVKGNGVIESADYLASSQVLSFGANEERYVDLVLREVD